MDQPRISLVDRLIVCQTGLTQASVARRLGVSEATYSRWLHGEKIPRDENIPALAEHLDLTPAELKALLAETRQRYTTAGELRQLQSEVAQLRAMVSRILDQQELILGRLPADPPVDNGGRRRVAG